VKISVYQLKATQKFKKMLNMTENLTVIEDFLKENSEDVNSSEIYLKCGEFLSQTITNIDGSCIAKESVPLPDGLKYFLIIILSIMFLVCTLGNSLTLVALTYVRSYYGREFTVLAGYSALLLLQLSVFDFLYGLVGFPHFIHALLVDFEDPFKNMDHGAKLCWTLAAFRNFFAEADFSTIGAIAFLACRQAMCKTCNGNYSDHANHDVMFQKKGVYTIIFTTWAMAAVSILPDALGITGNYVWSNTFYGCDVVYCGHKSYGMIINILLNVVVIISSYLLVGKKLYKEMKEIEKVFPDFKVDYIRHLKLLLLLAVCYCICVLPASLLCWGQFNIDWWFPTLDAKLIFTSILNIVYWCMFCINFIIYLLTFNRIKLAIKRFFWDMEERIWKRRQSIKSDVTDPHTFVHKQFDTNKVREWDLDSR